MMSKEEESHSETGVKDPHLWADDGSSSSSKEKETFWMKKREMNLKTHLADASP
jgi:hypothetical protein